MIDRQQSMWFCVHCQRWIGYEKTACTNGHDIPRYPLREIDVHGKPAYQVTRYDRIKGGVKSMLGGITA